MPNKCYKCACYYLRSKSSKWRKYYIMSKILATEIRVGNLLEWEKRVWKVLGCYHVHVGGRGGAFMQVEMKDIERGTKVNQRFRTDEKVDKAFVESRTMTFLYKEENNQYVFMDDESFEQINLDGDFLEGQTGYLLPNTVIQINFFNDRPISVNLPLLVALEVVDTDPYLKNATVTNSFKNATMETGLIVQVPPFVEIGDKIKVNTDSGKYEEKA